MLSKLILWKEYVEWETLNLYHCIMDFGREQLGWPENKYLTSKASSCLNSWEESNMRFPLSKLNSHADSYRFQWDLYTRLFYLRYPEKAPPEEDWMNNIDGAKVTPLQRLAFQPEIASLWEKDPFIQFIDKGAKADSQLISLICFKATDPKSLNKNPAIHMARIKKFIKQGVAIPVNLEDKEKNGLKPIFNFRMTG